MGKPRMYGMNNKQFFFHGKDLSESEERLDRMYEKKLRKEKLRNENESYA